MNLDIHLQRKFFQILANLKNYNNNLFKRNNVNKC